MELEDNDKLSLIIIDNIKEFGELVNQKLKLIRGKSNDYDYRVKVDLPRFSNGESKAVIRDSVRGRDTYILTDVGNYSCSYDMVGEYNRKSPDDHFMDLKRVISAIGGTTDKIHVVMPLLYGSRQHKKRGRESEDCAVALRELEYMGVKGIITFDAHDPSVRSSLNHTSFDNLFPTYSLLKKFMDQEIIDYSNLMIVAPDTGAIDRAKYYSQMLSCDLGFCYKRRDFSQVVNGKNPVLAHEYLGDSVEEKTIIITDDMIASGGSILETAEKLKQLGAAKVYFMVTFALFSNGKRSIEQFDNAYDKGIFDRIYATNLTYVPQYVKEKPWYVEANSADYLARIINNIHEEKSISEYLSGQEQKNKILSLRKNCINK